ELRDAGLSAAVDYAGRSMKAQMKQANKLNARYAAIMGDDELAEGVVMLRDMAGSEQEKVPVSDIINKVK
ncbi:MAG: histidine--tRNA ligase, partial [Lachnospiraceae bacterium]|nr:histidine--tRNA ligase [Lachnospiraceae bacterium]